MMKTFLSCISFFFCMLSGMAQSTLLPAFEISSDTATYLTLPNSKIQVLIEREDSPLSLQQIVLPQNQAAFSPIVAEEDAVIAGGRIIWMRYRIRNAMDRPLEITIPQNIKHADINVLDPDGKWNRYKTGTGIPYSARDGFKRIMNIIHTIPAKSEIVVYERNDNGNAGMRLTVMVGIKDNVLRSEYIENEVFMANRMFECIMGGFFLFGALFNLFFFNIVRERVYLFYAILLFFVGLNAVSPYLSLGLLREYTGMEAFYNFLGISLQFFLFVIVSLLFLEAQKNHRFWFRILISVNVLFLVLSIARIFFGIGVNMTMINAIRGLRYLLILGVLIVIVADFLKKRKAARLLMIANMPFIIIFTGSLIYSMPQISFLLTPAMIWAIVVLSWSLTDRYKSLQAENVRQALEKERLAREKEEERNELIARQNEVLELQVAERTSELTQSLAELKQTQTQLIQSEKMASLGELTAGIAHEIQNPLNFVNNFSDVSIELLEEMNDELQKGDTDEAKAIARDVRQNLEKIAHHGKRADSIVKGMLQHSRASSGQKEPTDINSLADEYLRLAYHGLRAKDKSFNAELVTQFDGDLPKINVVQQEVGRVLLNLFTNAFYATTQQQKVSGDDYKPTVTLRTSQKDTIVEIMVSDNGSGIPKHVVDKIFQPFFTTKPTGEGTGLGLSLAYDIIKAHGGKINLQSEEGKGTAFTIQLPIN
jgi:two-component system, NtrC family, sensor kinase